VPPFVKGGRGDFVRVGGILNVVHLLRSDGFKTRPYIASTAVSSIHDTPHSAA